MNLDGLTIHTLTKEIEKKIINGKIYKIFMPTKMTLLFIIKKQNETYNLMIDMSKATPLLYLADKTPSMPNTPPPFCMLLRKHLENGRINIFEQVGLDRVIKMTIDNIGNARQIVSKTIIFELTGKNSNVILTNNNTILDSLKHVTITMSSYRQILPNIDYIAPPIKNGLSLLTDSPRSIVDSIKENYDKPVLKALLFVTLGIGKFNAESILNLAKIDLTATGLTLSNSNNLLTVLTQFKALIKGYDEFQATSSKENPSIYGYISKRNVMKNLSLLNVEKEDLEVKPFQSITKALNYSSMLVPIQLPEKTILEKILKTALAKTEKKTLLLEKDLAKANNAEQEKIKADTLMTYLYKIKKGLNKITLPNIYNNEEIDITLSPLLSPVDNAQKYYKLYNKYKRAVSEIKLQQAEAKASLAYLKSIEVSLDTATTSDEISEIKAELIAEHIISEPNTKKRKSMQKKSFPIKIELDSNTIIYIGKNNKQNDYVTFHLGKSNDLWFHTKNIPGSHVLLKSLDNDTTFTEEQVILAAELAAYFSKAKDSINIPVDCIRKKYVKKPAKAKPGFVIFTNQKTYSVTPSKDKIMDLIKNSK